MAQYQTRPARALDKVDPVWARIRSEAEDVARREPELATFIYENILHHDTLEAAIAHRVSQRLDHADVSADLIRQAYHDALEDEPSLGEAFRPSGDRSAFASTTWLGSSRRNSVSMIPGETAFI